MRYPWVNTILLMLLIVQLLTGVGGLMSGSENFRWVLWLHGIGGYTIAILLSWKGIIIFDVFKRRWYLNLSRLGFIFLTGLVLVILVTGWIWTYMGSTYIAGFSLIVIHGFLACVLVAFLAWHTLAKWYVWRIPTARNRRVFLRLGSLSLLGLILRQMAEPAKATANLPGATRRFTGSYETGNFTGIFPETSWLFDHPLPLAAESWHLVVEGAIEHPLSLNYLEIEQLATDKHIALLDCTGGFYTIQEWTGVPLIHLLDLAGVKSTARSVTVEAISGYGRRFPITVARRCLLATQVANKSLSHGHGFPIRLVVPGYRGYDWVKWVSLIRINETSHRWQPPLPLQ